MKYFIASLMLFSTTLFSHEYYKTNDSDIYSIYFFIYDRYQHEYTVVIINTDDKKRAVYLVNKDDIDKIHENEKDYSRCLHNIPDICFPLSADKMVDLFHFLNLNSAQDLFPEQEFTEENYGF